MSLVIEGVNKDERGIELRCCAWDTFHEAEDEPAASAYIYEPKIP